MQHLHSSSHCAGGAFQNAQDFVAACNQKRQFLRSEMRFAKKTRLPRAFYSHDAASFLDGIHFSKDESALNQSQTPVSGALASQSDSANTNIATSSSSEATESSSEKCPANADGLAVESDSEIQETGQVEVSGRPDLPPKLHSRLSFTEGDIKNACSVCLEQEAELLVWPCGHKCLCGSCEPRLSTCPICRVPIRGKVYVYT